MELLRTDEKTACSSSPEEVAEEQKIFFSVVAAFKFYRTFSMSRVNKTEKYLNTLPIFHQEILVPYREHLNKIRHCIDENFQIIRKLIKDVETIFQQPNETCVKQENGPNANMLSVRPQDLESVQITLKQLARDWSSEGEEERDQCYKPIIDEIMEFFKPNLIDVSQIKILVPGAGLGRLAYELAYRGFYCEGNEFSFFMLIVSNFVLNKCLIENQYTIYPWIHQYVNNSVRQDQVHSVTFPDVSPTQAPPKGVLNMVAGDFLQVYTTENDWNCVATCFFIDCANNVAEFIENIYKILKPGAIWVNLGPLLYHYSDMPNEDSIEPTYEDIILIIQAIGFNILKTKTGVKTKYAQNPQSMQQSEYLSAFFVCQKPLDDLERDRQTDNIITNDQ